MTTTKVKTSELVGSALDWAVAWAEGDKVSVEDGYVAVAEFNEQHGDFFNVCYSPSTDWAQGGPLIEKHKMTIGADYDGESLVSVWAYVGPAFEGYPVSSAKTHLIAACLAIVAAKLGDVVSVPSELLEQMQ